MSDATKQDFYTIFVNRQTYFGMPVSIHAPAWGATISIITAIHSRAIFQSTHPRGVRPSTSARSDWSPDHFNPRTRVGCDRHALGGKLHVVNISIHAPAWGATTAKSISNHLLTTFQSTHPRGVRLEAVRPILASVLFQSTHPRGVRQFDCISNQKAQCISIHAPAWGATFLKQ